MKKLMLLAFVVLGALGCKKEVPKEEGNRVIYTIICESCTATLDTRNGVKEVEVLNFYQLGEINSLPTINITTTGYGSIKSILKVNDKIVHSEIVEQNGNTITRSVNIK